MKRSEINELIRQARACFDAGGWALPPHPRWDVTDFGLGRWREFGLVLINLAEEPEYCEKLMFALAGMRTPAHCHRIKKEDIICRRGELSIQVWPERPDAQAETRGGTVRRNGTATAFAAGAILSLKAGERVTLEPGMYHEFWPSSEMCIIGEVSTANDDRTDNVFVNPDIGRFPAVDEDEPAIVRLISDRS